MTNNEIALIIDAAVDCWHDVADEHDQKHCNCYRESLANAMIKKGFCGYHELDLKGELNVPLAESE